MTESQADHQPESPTPHPPPVPPVPSGNRNAGGKGRPLLRNSVQLIGFGLGIVLLIWCVRIVFSEENRAALERLRDASAWQIMALLAIAGSSILLNAVVFWITIRPLRPIRLADLVATNGIATFLSYLPFKVSVIARWVIHSRRDGVANLTIATWFLVVVGLTFVAIAPLGLAVVRPGGSGWWWWVVVVLAVAAAHWLAMVIARWVRGERGLDRLRRLRIPERVLGHEWFGRLHDGADMVGHGRGAWIAGAARVLDIIGFSARIGVAAAILGVPLSIEDTALIGLSYFVIGVLSPFGTVGTREAGSLGLALSAGVAAAQTHESALVTAILLVTVTDAVTSFVAAGFGLAWLRADRLLPGRSVLTEGPDLEPADEPTTSTDRSLDPDAHADPVPTTPTIDGEDRPGATEPDRR